MSLKFYDLTAVLSEKLPVYGGGTDPGITITAHYSMARGDRCNVSNLAMGNHTGTHADMPKHFVDDGATCETMPLGHFYGRARVLDLRPFLQGRKQATDTDLSYFDIQKDEIILLNMGNSHHMHSSVFTRDYVSVSEKAAAFLAEKKIKTVGVDYLSIEAAGSGTHPVHNLLLGNNIAILEGLLLEGVPQGSYTLSALPLKLADGNGSPVRAVLADDFDLQLVIFDMDGLMLDTEPVSHDGWCEAGKQMGFNMGEDIYRRLVGTNYNLCKQRMKDYMGYSFDFDEAYAIRSSYVRQHVDKHGISVKKGLNEILDIVDRLGIKKCVATSTDRKRAHELLSIVGIADRFDGMVGGDSIKNSKPDPEIFLKAASDCGVKPENCLVLEDSETGIQAAHRAGMRSVIVPDMFTPGFDVLAKVSAVCEDLNEAAELLLRMG
jgi:HAD superfamily hydrolase (TIGR01509 family)